MVSPDPPTRPRNCSFRLSTQDGVRSAVEGSREYSALDRPTDAPYWPPAEKVWVPTTLEATRYSRRTRDAESVFGYGAFPPRRVLCAALTSRSTPSLALSIDRPPRGLAWRAGSIAHGRLRERAFVVSERRRPTQADIRESRTWVAITEAAQRRAASESARDISCTARGGAGEADRQPRQGHFLAMLGHELAIRSPPSRTREPLVRAPTVRYRLPARDVIQRQVGHLAAPHRRSPRAARALLGKMSATEAGDLAKIASQPLAPGATGRTTAIDELAAGGRGSRGPVRLTRSSHLLERVKYRPKAAESRCAASRSVDQSFPPSPDGAGMTPSCGARLRPLVRADRKKKKNLVVPRRLASFSRWCAASRICTAARRPA